MKGVIRDKREAESLARAKRAEEVRELNRAMEKASLGGKTWAEEEKARERKRKEEGYKQLSSTDGRKIPHSSRYTSPPSLSKASRSSA